MVDLFSMICKFYCHGKHYAYPQAHLYKWNAFVCALREKKNIADDLAGMEVCHGSVLFQRENFV